MIKIIVGLVGKPNSGKSSLFKAATMIDVKITPCPFTTIKPNVGIGYVIADCVCKEFNVKCNPKAGKCENGKRFIPVKLIDVGGLIPGSHLGKGIGNKFLDDLRQASVLIQIADASGLTDSEGKPTVGYDPEIEMKFLEEEIDLWFVDVIRRAVEKFRSKLLSSTRVDLTNILSEQLSGLEVRKEQIEQALESASITDIEKFAKMIRRVSKPILIAANKIDLKEAQENFERLKKYENIIPTSAEAEIALKKAAEKGLIDYLPGNDFKVIGSLDEKQKGALDFIRKEVIEKYGSTGIQDCLNKAVFELLKYIVVYPVADTDKLCDKDLRVLPDAWLVPPKMKLRKFAYMIHTEIGERFICGIDARTKKRLGADYQLKDKDVIEIAFSK